MGGTTSACLPGLRAIRRAASGACAALLVSTAGTMLAACGSTAHRSTTSRPQDFHDAYRAAITSYRNDFSGLQAKARTAIGGDPSAELEIFAQMSDVTHAAAVALRELAPPAEVADTYHRLLSTLQTQESSLRDIQASARTNNSAALNTALTTYASALQDEAALQRQVEDAVAPTASHS
jgi:hypothetical protein